jgi:hypothetical protein
MYPRSISSRETPKLIHSRASIGRVLLYSSYQEQRQQEPAAKWDKSDMRIYQ